MGFRILSDFPKTSQQEPTTTMMMMIDNDYDEDDYADDDDEGDDDDRDDGLDPREPICQNLLSTCSKCTAITSLKIEQFH